MNVVPFLCPMALNLHQKRPSSVTSGRLFHRTIRREIAAPSFVLMAMVQQSYPRHPPFHRAIRRESAVPSFVLMGDGAAKLPRHPPFHHTIRRETAALSSVLMGDGAAKLPPSSAIPPRNTTRNCGAIIRFDARWCKEITPLGVILSLIPRTLSLHLAIVLPGAAVGFVLRLHAL